MGSLEGKNLKAFQNLRFLNVLKEEEGNEAFQHPRDYV
jgi:hypothetical protein